MALKHLRRVKKNTSSAIIIFIKDVIAYNSAISANTDRASSTINSSFMIPAIIIAPPLYYYIDVIIKSDAKFN